MEESYDDIPPELLADYATNAPRSVSSDSQFVFPTPQVMQPASQNYRRSPKSSPTCSTGISNGSGSGSGMDVESGWPARATQPGAYMVPMRAVGARPGWANTNRRSWNNRIPSFMQSFRVRNPVPESQNVPTHRVEMHEVSVVQDATVVLQNPPVVFQDSAPVPPNGGEITGDSKDEGQCGRKFTWVHVAILGLIFGAVIAGIVWFLASKESQTTQSQYANGTKANDALGSGQPFEPSSSEFLAAKEAYMPLVLSVSKEEDFTDVASAQSKALLWLAASAPLDPATSQPPMSVSRLLTRYSLAVLYYSTNGEGWQNSLGFLDIDSHECEWNIPLDFNATFETAGYIVDKRGIVCRGNQDDLERNVEILNLGTNSLGGGFPDSELNALGHLKVGIFNNNSISGSLPTNWKPKSVVHLDFSYNKFSSTIPSMLLSRSSQLTNLRLSGNKLHGTLPSEIGKASNLRILALGNNGLEGSVPAELIQLTQLEELVLEQNKFTRQLPTDIGHMKSLAKLNLNHNSFTGVFPWQEFGNRENCSLTYLNLGSNSFVGSIPWDILSNSTLVGWTCLQELTLKSSGFTAETIPDTAFDNWVNMLKYLDLSDMLARGTIPTTISSLSKLEFLDLGTNGMTGTIPDTITELENLRFLNLYFNSLGGPIPSELGTMSNLLKIDLMGNRFNKTIPESLGSLGSLKVLHLRQNELTGTVPAVLSELKNLTLLTLAINSLQGTMDEFCNSGQQFLDLSADCLTEVRCSCCTACH